MLVVDKQLTNTRSTAYMLLELSHWLQLSIRANEAKTVQRVAPDSLDGVTVSGVALRTVGLRPPILASETALLLEILSLE